MISCPSPERNNGVMGYWSYGVEEFLDVSQFPKTPSLQRSIVSGGSCLHGCRLPLGWMHLMNGKSVLCFMVISALFSCFAQAPAGIDPLREFQARAARF